LTSNIRSSQLWPWLLYRAFDRAYVASFAGLDFALLRLFVTGTPGQRVFTPVDALRALAAQCLLNLGASKKYTIGVFREGGEFDQELDKYLVEIAEFCGEIEPAKVPPFGDGWQPRSTPAAVGSTLGPAIDCKQFFDENLPILFKKALGR
jgi:hypothetical protein